MQTYYIGSIIVNNSKRGKIAKLKKSWNLLMVKLES